ncbi:hypothetical protein B4135_1242 [Caldibacillus debilis]|uniref:Uncharacterized protein n=1 Tax=Caldibacillus debilis TaxID=301148 RepID=A0A150MDV7_9BACI|nr:hypothetical protein B4135_1242 [Caldibacillus debilis]
MPCGRFIRTLLRNAFPRSSVPSSHRPRIAEYREERVLPFLPRNNRFLFSTVLLIVC